MRMQSPPYADLVQPLWEAFLGTEDGSPEEEINARMLGELYLLLTAEKTASSDSSRHGIDKQAWSERFTQASKELWGQLEQQDVKIVIGNQMKSLEALVSRRPNSPEGKLATTALELIGNTSIEERELGQELVLSEEVADDVRSFMWEQIGPGLTVLENLEDQHYKLAEVCEIYSTCLGELAEVNPVWSDWGVTKKANSSAISTDSKQHLIKIGEKLRPRSKTSLIINFAHEVGVHGLRQTNAEKLGDKNIQQMAGYIDFEEGLATIVGKMMTGGEFSPSRLSADNFGFIALAVGKADVCLSVPDLTSYIQAVKAARMFENGEDIDTEKAYRVSQRRIQRIFRGGDGQMHNGNQSVFTKDIVYFTGQTKAVRFILDSMDKGQLVPEIMEYLLQGKFDPTKQSHSDYINSLK